MKFESILHIIKNDGDTDLSKAYYVFVESLSQQQRIIFQLIPATEEYAISAKEIEFATGIPTPNISSIIKYLQTKCDALKSKKVNERKCIYWKEFN